MLVAYAQNDSLSKIRPINVMPHLWAHCPQAAVDLCVGQHTLAVAPSVLRQDAVGALEQDVNDGTIFVRRAPSVAYEIGQAQSLAGREHSQVLRAPHLGELRQVLVNPYHLSSSVRARSHQTFSADHGTLGSREPDP